MQAKGDVQEVSMMAFWEMLKKRKFTVLITALLLAAVAAIYAFMQPDRYRADVPLIGRGRRSTGLRKVPRGSSNN